MRIRIVFLIASVLSAVTGQALASDVAYTVSAQSFGPVQFGMTVQAAEGALGVKLTKDNAGDDESCRYYTPATGFKGVSFMTSAGVIVRVDIWNGSNIATDAGARIGDTEQRVRMLYKGRVRVKPHAYTAGGHYLVVSGANGKAQMVFETDHGKVESYRAGREPEVEYVEGCS